MKKYKKLLSDKFFNENPPQKIPTPPAMIQFAITIRGTEAMELLKKYSSEGLMPERIISCEEEAEKISSLSTGDEVIRQMRKTIDPINSELVLDKALMFEDEIAMTVIKKLATSWISIFIENAVKFLAKCEMNYSSTLIEIFDEIRNPYAQSLVFIVLGLRGDEDTIPWMYDKFFEFKKKYADTDKYYEEGALLALYDLDRRFNYGENAE